LITPASSWDRTRLARPSLSRPTTSADRTAEAHSGYEAKSAITAMTSALGAATAMLEVALEAMHGAYRYSSST
jgi:hypothetical protein